MPCCPPNPDTDIALFCHRCGARGHRVDRLTVSALLTEAAMKRITSADYGFCASVECPTVYFQAGGQAFVESDIRVPVWQKQPPGERMICYCFGENEREIRLEIEDRGQSDVERRVREYIAAGLCACEVRNPRGNCCLADIMCAVKRSGAPEQHSR